MDEEIAKANALLKYGYKLPKDKPKRNKTREPHKDCFAYRNINNTSKCMSLKEVYCQWEECHFYKSYNKFIDEKNKFMEEKYGECSS